MKLVLELLLWCQGSYVAFINTVCSTTLSAIVLTVLAFGMKTVTLEVIQPCTGPVCPGQEVILTCTVIQTGAVAVTFLNWRLGSTALTVQYNSYSRSSGPDTLGDFITTAVFMSSTTSTVIVSNATLTSAALSNSNSTLSCISPPQDIQTASIVVAGIYN